MEVCAYVVFCLLIQGQRLLLGSSLTHHLYSFIKLQKHSTEINFHKGAMADMHTFIAIMEQRRPSVIHLANSAHSAVVEKNRLVLKSILECVVFCGKQNTSFRGHQDDDT